MDSLLPELVDRIDELLAIMEEHGNLYELHIPIEIALQLKEELINLYEE